MFQAETEENKTGLRTESKGQGTVLGTVVREGLGTLSKALNKVGGGAKLCDNLEEELSRQKKQQVQRPSGLEQNEGSRHILGVGIHEVGSWVTMGPCRLGQI